MTTTSKDKVLQLYPDAFLQEWNLNMWVVVGCPVKLYAIASGETVEAAWEAAAVACGSVQPRRNYMKHKTDRELIELAAKAIRFKGTWQDGHFPGLVGPGINACDVPWNPLQNSGQALQLLGELATHTGRIVALSIGGGQAACEFHYVTYVKDQPDVAVRRAIVIAAATIGEEL